MLPRERLFRKRSVRSARFWVAKRLLYAFTPIQSITVCENSGLDFQLPLLQTSRNAIPCSSCLCPGATAPNQPPQGPLTSTITLALQWEQQTPSVGAGAAPQSSLWPLGKGLCQMSTQKWAQTTLEGCQDFFQTIWSSHAATKVRLLFAMHFTEPVSNASQCSTL